MIIQLNGQPSDVADDFSVALLIESLRYGGRRLAVEINGEIIPRSNFASVLLQENDRVEIVQAIGGG